MYLKSLEIVGFKSFAERTKLDFEPGMTAIVGPNGCGKSNISDSIRWVLGEQSAKALRGSKMEDCIFNGTDDRKPLGMAEVSITFAGCEGAIPVEYDEVTITRRVFRSGEGQYFLNKTPCRLKDIHRLFLGTGVGTSSYSLMEQGRIDQILSSRPEDRRTIFEEASGITKFKADKKEAIRKLEYTEANLLRLADVIREVKRQIGSLQRQAGKARRYQELHQEMKTLDIHSTRQRLVAMDCGLRDVETEIQTLTRDISTDVSGIQEREKNNASLRQGLVEIEREIGTVMEAGIQARGRLDHTREVILMNSRQIGEYRSFAERDSREIEEDAQQLAERRSMLAELETQKASLEEEHSRAQEELKTCTARFDRHQQETDAARAQIQRLREKSLEQENLSSRLQNQLVEIDSRERSTMIRRERLAAEKAQLARVVSSYEQRIADMDILRVTAETDVRQEEATLQSLEQDRTDRESELHRERAAGDTLKLQAATAKAQMEMLAEREDSQPENGSSIREQLLSETDGRSRAMGMLATHVDVTPPYRVALEAVLRPWLDAILVPDAAGALDCLRIAAERREGAVRVLTVAGPHHEPQPDVGENSERLADQIQCSDEIRPLINRLIGDTRVVPAIDNIPSPIPAHAVYVTLDGCVVRGDGWFEFWMDDTASSPLSRKHLLQDTQAELNSLSERIVQHEAATQTLTVRIEGSNASIRESRRRLDEKKYAHAQKDGEKQIVSSEAREARDRLSTVTWELDSLQTEEKSGRSERDDIARQLEEIRSQREKMATDIKDQGEMLHTLETRRTELQSEVTEHRIRFAELSQKKGYLETQLGTVLARANELELAVNDRSNNVRSYQTEVERLTEAVREAESRIEALQADAESHTARAEALRQAQKAKSEELEQMESALADKRAALDALRETKSRLDVQIAETRMRRQNQIDRIASEYNLTVEEILATPPPENELADFSLEMAETRVAELRTKIEAMGPVNLVAIEEYKELEERHAFLTTQEQDLITSKQQLMDMIRTINKTTSEMFQKTFEQANINFQAMFKKMFNGGAAKLVLVNEEDVLECGIEIIARPPGKKLQNVSLLSGGERTLTAVSLLFAIYTIKPSPFCLLDELDAALDETNIGRFVNILQGFLNQSQFVVITHNRQTIAAASVLYGITMPQRGISKIVSMKFKDKEEEKPQIPA